MISQLIDGKDPADPEYPLNEADPAIGFTRDSPPVGPQVILHLGEHPSDVAFCFPRGGEIVVGTFLGSDVVQESLITADEFHKS